MKTIKFLTMIILLIGANIIAGCGGDKFVGTWYTEVNGEIQQLSIEKNGDGYLMNYQNTNSKESKTMINKAEYDADHKTLAEFGSVNKNRVEAIYDVKYEWKTTKGQSFTASAKDGKLFVDGYGPFGVFAYVEKDDTLQNNNVIYTKEGKTSLEKMKEAKKARIKDRWNKKEGIYYKVRNIDLFGEIVELNK